MYYFPIDYLDAHKEKRTRSAHEYIMKLLAIVDIARLLYCRSESLFNLGVIDERAK